MGGIFQAQLKTTTRRDGIFTGQLNAMTGGFEKSDRKFLEHVMYLMYLVLKPCWLIIILGLRIYIKSILSTKKLSMGNFVCISGLVARDWCKYFYFPRNIFIFKIYFYFPRNISIFQEMEGWKYS